MEVFYTLSKLVHDPQIRSMYRGKDIVLQSYTKIFTKIVDPVLNGPEQEL